MGQAAVAASTPLIALDRVAGQTEVKPQQRHPSSSSPARRAPPTAMAALPRAPSPSPSPSNPCLKSTPPKAEHGTDAVERVGGQGFDGGEPEHGTEGVGRVDGQRIHGGEPLTRTDDGVDPTMRADAAGGKRPQSKDGSLIKKRKKHSTDSSHISRVPELSEPAAVFVDVVLPVLRKNRSQG